VNLLFLGGTAFLGRHLVELALERGHTVTLFHRGRTNPNLFPQAETILGDRKVSLDLVSKRKWDAVIDTSGYHPQEIRASTGLLARNIGRYIFISTISVYADFSQSNSSEDAPLLRLDDPESATVSNETYGALKTHCEDVVQSICGRSALIIRPGLIVGPHDPTDRFTYWPVRVQRGGEILAPQAPDVKTQYIDVRDLAGWILLATERDLSGIYNATGPAQPQPLGALLESCRSVAGADARFIWASPEFLAEHQVAPFLEMPLWVPPPMQGLLTVNIERAIHAGLTFRPAEETIQDTLDWHATRPPDIPLKAGLSPEREAALLAAWHTHLSARTTHS
jgi:2'-hydroxyisoflavone reductase